MTPNELRVAIAVDDFDAAARFYGEAMDLPVSKQWGNEEGRGVVFELPRGTLEIVDAAEARSIDLAEVGAVVGEPVRIAIGVDDVEEGHAVAIAAGAIPLGGPADMPWGGRNARVRAPGGIQLTLFAHPDDTV